MMVLVYVYTRSTQIQWGKWLIFYHMAHWTLIFPYVESVVILPSLGVQFETHKGFAGVSLLAARKFIPWASLEDFLINEGLYGWNVRYYCVAMNRTPHGSLQLEVAFEVGGLRNSSVGNLPNPPLRTYSQGSQSSSRYTTAYRRLFRPKMSDERKHRHYIRTVNAAV